MDYLDTIITENEINAILNSDVEDSIPIGETVDFKSKKVINFFNLWCNRIDKLVALDKEVHGKATWRTHHALSQRGFTYEEFGDLFNTHIKETQFPFYPIFNQVRKAKGGINTEKQRATLTSYYENDDENYLELLLAEGYGDLLKYFFFAGLSRFNAYIPLKKLQSHCSIIAPSGSGKTVLLESIFFRITKKCKKNSFILLDPHGDISKRAKLHRHLKDRLIYIDPFLDDKLTPTFNPFSIKDRSLKNINNTAEMIILAFSDVLSREGGDLTETMINMLEKCIYFLLYRPNSTMFDLVGLLNRDEILFQQAAKQDKFFNEFFLKPNNKTREGLLNRIGRLMNSPILSNLLGGHSTFDLENAINRNKVVIFNLGGLGEMSQISFGKFLIASLKSIIRKRNKPSKKHTYCFIDECHNFLGGNESAEYILSQLRGFGLHMILANQYVEQLGNQAKSIKQNTAIKILGGGMDNLSDISKMIDIKNNASLKDYEFFLKVRGRTILKFKSPSTLLSGSTRYYLTNKEEKELDKNLLQKFYKPIGDLEAPIQETKGWIDEVKETKESISTTSPKPDLGLYINDK